MMSAERSLPVAQVKCNFCHSKWAFAHSVFVAKFSLVWGPKFWKSRLRI